MLNSRRITINTIFIPQNRQEPSVEAVRLLADSMAEIGLINPVTVQWNMRDLRCLLVAGRTRLEAAKLLGWDEIDVIELPKIDGTASVLGTMAEIAENLHRREITALERSELLAKWVRLTEEKRQVQSAGNEHSKPAQLAPVSKGGRGKVSGIRQAAREIGVPRDSIARAVKVAGLSDEAKEAAKEAGLADNQSALLAAAKEPTPEAQVAAIEARATSTQPPTAAPPGFRSWDEAISTIEKVWSCAPDDMRARIAAILGDAR